MSNDPDELRYAMSRLSLLELAEFARLSALRSDASS